uniref:GDP/GTP exchange factor Sec2 N-terminal domain-containing protein n=1 Tax=Panagrolaimus sp. PS1159 TaxID=55785 RepID=A0AC35G8Q0_9BILA
MFYFQPLKTPDSVSVTDSGIDCSLLEEINRQAAVVLNSPLIQRKTREDPEDPLPPTITTNTTTNYSYILSKPHGSFDLTLQTSQINNTSSSNSSSPQQAVSEPPRSPPTLSSTDSTTVFSSSTDAPNSSHIGILLLSNARRKLQLEEERIEFEKEKQREKEKRKSKKLFFRLSKRVREKSGMVDIPQSASDSALKRIDEDEVSSTGHSSFFGQYRNSSTDSGLIPSSADDPDETLEEKVKRLEHELKESRRVAAKSDAECQKLLKMQKTLDNEVQDLTETLFQQAYHVADEAEAKRRQAEKLLNEALFKVDLLQAEVKALKDIVKSPSKRTLKDRFGHKKSESQVYSLTPTKGKSSSLHLTPIKSSKSSTSISQEEVEVDPIYFEEFNEWLSSSISLSSDNGETKFLKRVIKEDVEPCLTFTNAELALKILDSIKKNTLEMEPCLNETIKICELTKIEKLCPYRLKTEMENEWVYISLQARNRITAVCDLLTYLRYLQNGIVKSAPHDSYLEIASMRKNLALARFGFDFITKMNGTGLTTTDEN